MVRRVLFLMVVAGIGFLGWNNSSTISAAFSANIPLNSFILGLFLVGVVALVRQFKELQHEMHWVVGYREGRPRIGSVYFPKLLAPLAVILGQRDQVEALPPEMTRTLLDIIRERLEDKRHFVRYLVGVLIFLGLLGTFWGLLQTIGAISHVIGNLPSGLGDSVAFFEHLKQGLKAPLGGMGIAFSASMFGLAASLVLGFFDLQVGRLYRDFYQEIEEWLLGLPLRGETTTSETRGGSNPIFLNNLVEKLAMQLQDLRQMLEQNTDYNAGLGKNVLLLSERTAAIADFMKTEQSLMLKIAEHQLELQNLLKAFHEDLKSGAAGVNDATQNHIRNLDVTVTQLANQMNTQQTRAVSEICSEIRFLTKTITQQLPGESPKVAVN